MNSKVTFNDNFPQWGISVDCKGTIHDIHKYASMYGGCLTVYDISKTFPYYSPKSFRLSYRLVQPPFEFMIFGIELTEDQYITQMLAWNGNDSIILEGKSEITLIDNEYLLIRSDNVVTHKFSFND